jgi:hypothetical protein
LFEEENNNKNKEQREWHRNSEVGWQSLFMWRAIITIIGKLNFVRVIVIVSTHLVQRVMDLLEATQGGRVHVTSIHSQLHDILLHGKQLPRLLIQVYSCDNKEIQVFTLPHLS